MRDQATKLRQLVQESSSIDSSATAPPTVVLSGCRAGVGTTMVAIELAETLATGGQRVVLIDANLQNAGATRRLANGVPSSGTVADILSGQKTIVEVLETCPHGLELLPGSTPDMAYLVLGARERFDREIARLDRLADVIVIDAGHGFSPWTETLWKAANLVLALAVPDDLAANDTCTMLRLAGQSGLLPVVRLLVNQSGNETQADCIHQHIGQAIFRDLGELVHAAHALPVRNARGRNDSDFVRELDLLAASVCAQLGTTFTEHLDSIST